MKTILVVGVAFMLVGCFGDHGGANSNTEHKESTMEAERQAIEQVLFAYRDALNASSTDAVVQLYAADGVFMPSNAPTAEGVDQVRSAYNHVFENIRLDIDFFVDAVDVDGDVSCARTSSKGTTLIHATGQTVPEENRELFVLRKQDCQWRIWRYMFNKTQ